SDAHAPARVTFNFPSALADAPLRRDSQQTVRFASPRTLVTRDGPHCVISAAGMASRLPVGLTTIFRKLLTQHTLRWSGFFDAVESQLGEAGASITLSQLVKQCVLSVE